MCAFWATLTSDFDALWMIAWHASSAARAWYPGSPYRSGQKPEGTCREAARQKKTGAADISSLPTKRLMSHEKPRRHGKSIAQNARALATFEQ
jgi:hypothetical protein